MKECNKRFLERNGISIEDVCSKIDCHIYSSREINPIISNYGFQTKEESQMVSIADIVGYDTQFREINQNIFMSMDSFFDDKGTGYLTRSLGMLEYDTESIIESLRQSFELEPISLIETGEGTYTVFNNGLHRYTLLRILYLSEAAKANGDKEKLAEIAKKYTIQVEVTGVDLDKTYCKYLLQMINVKDDEWKVTDIQTEYDSKYNLTGNVIVKYANGEKEALSNELLLLLTKERIAEDETFKENYPQLQRIYDRYSSFRQFIDGEFPTLISLQKREENEKGINGDD